jgi:hypothetical protein
MATTTPNYGWDVPTSSDYVKQGAVAIETLGDDIDASLFSITGGKNVGWVPIATVTLTNASLITFNSIFSATYDKYYVDIALTGGGSATDMNINLKSGATVINGANYNYLRQFFGLSLTTMNNQTSFPVARMETPGNSTQIFINNPFLAQRTFITSTSYDTAYLAVAACNHTLSTSYDGFQIGVAANTNGIVTVYGKRNS